MTFSEILSREENNRNTVYLYKEGIFLKAYERSAYLVYMNIHEFKVSRRYVKSVNQEIFSLGFPESSAPKWLYGYRYTWITDRIVMCEINKECDEVGYHAWKETVPVNASDRYTVHTRVIEKAPVYKTAYDLLLQVLAFSVNVSRNMMNPIGMRLKELSYTLCYKVRNLYDVPDREKEIDGAVAICDEIAYILQILKDTKEISLKAFALSSERVISVSRQLVALRGKVKA